MIKISIADNQPVVMHGIKCFFKNHTNISVSDTIYHLKDLEESLQSKKVTVLVIDLELAGLHNISSLKKIIQNHLHTKVLIYTCASEKLFGMSCLKAGAVGFVSKTVRLKEFEEAILKISNGETVFSALVHKTALTAARMSTYDVMYRKLSARETEVLQYLMNGKKNYEISELLNLNEKTISTYKLRLLNKLYVTNLIDLVNKAKTLEIV